jgi:hypothetical protein
VTVVEPERTGAEGARAAHRSGTDATTATGGPATAIHPDRDRWWVGRLMPLLRRHRARIVLSLVAAALALGIQVAIPRVIGLAIDGALDARTSQLWPFVAALVVLAVVRGVLTTGYRYGLYGTSAPCRSASTTGCSPARSSVAPTATSGRCRCSSRSRRSWPPRS